MTPVSIPAWRRPSRARGPLLAAAAGAALFLLRFGGAILAPGRDQWLLARDDCAMNYLGWLFFRREPWALPLGHIGGYLWPAGTTTGMTDSLPLLAVPLKALGFLLPARFQYFGVWLLLCYALQGTFGWLLAGSLTTRAPLRAAIALLILLFPPFLLSDGHLSLSAHWLLLGGLWLYLRGADPERPWRALRDWSLLLAAAAAIHPYLAIMTATLALAHHAREGLVARRLPRRHLLIALAAVPAVLFAVWGLFGYVLYGESTDYAGLGYARSPLDLNALWNPLGASRLLPDLPVQAAVPREGLQYLGLGLLAAAAIAIVLLIRRPQLRPRWRGHWPLLAALTLLTLLALGARPHWSGHEPVSLPLPGWAERALAIFPASGRLFWPVGYALAGLAVAAIARALSPRSALAILAACVAVQAIDLSRVLDQRATYAGFAYATRLQSPLWDEAMRGYDRLITCPPFRKETDFEGDFRDFALLALRHGAVTTAGYTSRLGRGPVERFVTDLRRQMNGGPVDRRALYVLRAGYFAGAFPDLRRDFDCTRLDRFVVCFPKGTPHPAPDRVYAVQPYTLADYLARAGGGTLALATRGDAAAALPADARAVLGRMGAHLDGLRPGGAYVALIHAGAVLFDQASPGTAIVAEGAAGDQLGALMLRRPLSLSAAGPSGGDAASIAVGDVEMSFNCPGLNVVALDEDQRLVEAGVFDPAGGGPGLVYRLVPPDRATPGD